MITETGDTLIALADAGAVRYDHGWNLNREGLRYLYANGFETTYNGRGPAGIARIEGQRTVTQGVES